MHRLSQISSSFLSILFFQTIQNRNRCGIILERWGARRPKWAHWPVYNIAYRRAHIPIRDIVNGPVCSWRVDIFPRRKALPLKLRNSLASPRTSHHTPTPGECAASPHLGTLNPAPLLCRSGFQRRVTSITAVCTKSLHDHKSLKKKKLHAQIGVIALVATILVKLYIIVLFS